MQVGVQFGRFEITIRVKCLFLGPHISSPTLFPSPSCFYTEVVPEKNAVSEGGHLGHM